MFAYAADGVPTSVRCDPVGNVYASCGDGIEVWSPGGLALGLIEVPGSSFSKALTPLTPLPHWFPLFSWPRPFSVP